MLDVDRLPPLSPPPPPTAPPPNPRPLVVAVFLRAGPAWPRLVLWLLVPALLLALPVLAFEFDNFRAQSDPLTATQPPRHPWTFFADAIAVLVLQGMAATALATRMRGEPLALAPLLRTLLRILLPTALVGVIFLGIIFAIALVAMAFAALHPALAAFTVLAVLPSTILVLAPSVVALEQAEPMIALRRSAFLTLGYRRAAFLVILLMGALEYFVGWGLLRLTQSLSLSTSAGFNVILGSQLLTETFGAVGLASLYVELRMRRDGAAPIPASEP